ncbi:response regulator [Aridibaculum aurantiacum]|uniref:response regulator n=1 Tax=Aridibaculum aurantiacum TaxID=2810307 RepID=UPI001A977E1E|nr:response regulator [Aridibaculum aurantiacum]
MSRYSNVLLVEDDPITIMVCDRIIKMSDFAQNVVSCENGKYAIDHIKRIIDEGKQFPEIIFLDINMPVMNGWDFLEEFEALKDMISPMPRIFILSSTVDPEDYKRAKSFTAVDNFISKPLSKEFLDDIK